ncbi:MAG: ketopantoate reductase family protein [Anaerolineae bacterium]|nr:ketopantoate reductase family protein [Anaerolineae bacterium]
MIVAILGAGALGAAYASKFYAADPNCISFIASGERAARLKAEGVIVNSQQYAIPITTPDDAGDTPPADLILVALKHQHLAGAIPDLAHRVGENTLILSVMNGLDSEPMLAEVYGWDKVVYAVAVGIDALRTGNAVTFTHTGTIFVGDADNTHLSARIKCVQTLLDRAQIPWQTPADMIRNMWWKFMINVGINQASAVLRAPYGVFQTSEHAQAIMETAMREVIAVAQAEQVNLGEEDITNWYTVLNTLHPEGKTSMLQDIEARRTTEVDIFAGKMLALGAQHNIPTPVNETLLHAIKVFEQG